VIAGVIADVIPNSGPLYGTNYVTILGSNLGNGSDISSVLLNNISATIVKQNQSSVVVIASGSTSVGSGVVVFSVSFGYSFSNNYTYNPRMFIFLCTVPLIDRQVEVLQMLNQ